MGWAAMGIIGWAVRWPDYAWTLLGLSWVVNGLCCAQHELDGSWAGLGMGCARRGIG